MIKHLSLCFFTPGASKAWLFPLFRGLSSPELPSSCRSRAWIRKVLPQEVFCGALQGCSSLLSRSQRNQRAMKAPWNRDVLLGSSPEPTDLSEVSTPHALPHGVQLPEGRTAPQHPSTSQSMRSHVWGWMLRGVGDGTMVWC